MGKQSSHDTKQKARQSAFYDHLVAELNAQDLSVDESDGILRMGVKDDCTSIIGTMVRDGDGIEAVLVLFDKSEMLDDGTPPIMEADTFARAVELCNIINSAGPSDCFCYVPTSGARVVMFKAPVEDEADTPEMPLGKFVSLMKRAKMFWPAFNKILTNDSISAVDAFRGNKFDALMMTLRDICKAKNGDERTL